VLQRADTHRHGICYEVALTNRVGWLQVDSGHLVRAACCRGTRAAGERTRARSWRSAWPECDGDRVWSSRVRTQPAGWRRSCIAGWTARAGRTKGGCGMASLAGLFGDLPPAVTLVNIDWSALRESKYEDEVERMIEEAEHHPGAASDQKRSPPLWRTTYLWEHAWRPGRKSVRQSLMRILAFPGSRTRRRQIFIWPPVPRPQ
jgi:hypothetical protein